LAQWSAAPQFATAEYAHIPGTERCRICSSLVSGEYYRVNNQMACTSCGAQALQGQPTDSHGAFLRGLLLGVGGAVLGMILYSTVVIVTGWSIGYLALAVGWLVAKAMMKGSNGMGGMRYQIAAVVLTYAAISISAVPISIASAIKDGQFGHSRQSASSPQTSGNADASAGSPEGDQAGTAPSLGAVALQLLLLGIASPFLELQDPGHGIIGLVILFVGLSIAFRQTAARPLNVDGPYPVTA